MWRHAIVVAAILVVLATIVAAAELSLLRGDEEPGGPKP